MHIYIYMCVVGASIEGETTNYVLVYVVIIFPELLLTIVLVLFGIVIVHIFSDSVSCPFSICLCARGVSPWKTVFNAPSFVY